jgi:tartrate-resistant acid phosphatase type 5
MFQRLPDSVRLTDVVVILTLSLVAILSVGARPYNLENTRPVVTADNHNTTSTSSEVGANLGPFRFTSAASCTRTTTTFAVIGDYGSNSGAGLDVSNLVKSWSPDFIITVGDNNYSSGSAVTIDRNVGQYYHEFIGNYTGNYGPGAARNNFYPALGNHDWRTTSGTPPLPQPYLDYFTLPGNERYYHFSRGPVEFFAIDSDSKEPHGRSSTSIQATWLRNRLNASTSPWKVVYMHHPPYSSGIVHGSEKVMQWPYREWGATAVLAGHDHTYERIIVEGLPYFVNGLGGAGKYSFGNPISGSVIRYSSDRGAMLVKANSLCMTFQFISRAGTVIDTYSIFKGTGIIDTFLPIIFKL